MANAFRIANVVARAMADTFTTQLDSGSGALLRIYSGTQPTDPDTALAGNTLLAELAMSSTSFGAAADAAPGGRITANAITADSSADATGTAAFFHLSLSLSPAGVPVRAVPCLRLRMRGRQHCKWRQIRPSFLSMGNL